MGRAPKGRDRDRADRRAVVDVLLARAQRGALTPAEATLLAEHVHEEQRLADQTRTAMAGTTQALERHRAAADAAIVEAEQRAEQADERVSNLAVIVGNVVRVAEQAGAREPSVIGAVRALAQRAEAAENRTRLAHDARRTKIGHLDEVHRALLDTGVIEDDDPYGHADLADVIRQAMTDRAHVEQGDASALRLTHSAAAAWEQRADRAEQAARRAEAALARVWNARTVVDAWTALGMYYGTTPEEAGRRARTLRTADERIAEQRAETARQRATDAARSADRYRAAWQSARHRAAMYLQSNQRFSVSLHNSHAAYLQLAEVTKQQATTPAQQGTVPSVIDPLADSATEYRVPVPEQGGTNLHVRRQRAASGTGWSVAVPGWGGGRAWTQEGWQETISALSVDRLFCWPDAHTAVAEARRALAITPEPQP